MFTCEMIKNQRFRSWVSKKYTIAERLKKIRRID